MVLASAIVFLDATIVNVALETIGRELPSTSWVAGGPAYVTAATSVTLSALLILAGALADSSAAGGCSASAWPASAHVGRLRPRSTMES